MNISVVGLGKLGACYAVAAANKGMDVVGYDLDDDVVGAMQGGFPHIDENNYGVMLRHAKERGTLRVTRSLAEAVADSTISLVVVPTPSLDDGDYDLDCVQDALGFIAEAISEKDDYHLVVLVSTVSPGACEHVLIPWMEAFLPNKKLGKDWGFCYSPEFIAIGAVLDMLTNPDFSLIGASDDKAAYQLREFYGIFYDNEPPFHRMSLVNAEIAKIAVNSYITMKITYANMLSRICERVPGGDSDKVADALGSDARIGRKFLTGGLGYGGPCLPRDNRALALTLKRLGLGVEARLPRTIDDENDRIPGHVLSHVVERFGGDLRGMSAVVMGLSYKPGTPLVEESQAITVANRLSMMGADVAVFDPRAKSRVHLRIEGLHDDVQLIENIHETGIVDDRDIVIFATADRYWTTLNPSMFKPGALILDCWRVVRKRFGATNGKFRYRALGVGPETDEYGLLSRAWEADE